jgi:hypothetical protein
MGHIHGAHRPEVLLFPECLADDIAEDNPVRFLDAFVDELDLVACGCQRAGPAATGIGMKLSIDSYRKHDRCQWLT